MPINNKCPICNEEMKPYVDLLDGHVLMEERFACNAGHYSYEYVTGQTSITVGSITVLFGYEIPFEELKYAYDVVDFLIEQYKKIVV